MFNFKREDSGLIDTEVPKRGLKVENFPFVLLLVLVFVAPIIFLPASLSIYSATKIYFVCLVSLCAFFVWILAKIHKSTLTLPLNTLSLSILLIPVMYIISASLSSNQNISFFGRDFALDSAFSIVSLFMLFVVAISTLKNTTRVLNVYLLLFLSFLIVALIQLLNLIPVFPNFGFFSTSSVSTVGKWNELSVFALVVTSLSIITSSCIKLPKKREMVNKIVLGLGILILILVNFKISWYILGILVLVLFVNTMVVNRRNGNHAAEINWTHISILLLSLVFIVSGNSVGDFISSKLKVNSFEVRPSWASTIDVVKDSWSEGDVLFGVGPALFENQWVAHRPSRILPTDFWNLDFRYGVGLIPTYFVTTGVLGGLTWFFFLILFLFYGIKAMLKEKTGIIEHYITFSSFTISAILWIINIVYLPGSVLVSLTLIFTGIFIASLYRDGILSNKEIILVNYKKLNVLYPIILILILIGTAGMVYKSTNKFLAQVYFQKASYAFSVTGDTALAEQNIKNALNLNKNDNYLRSMSELNNVYINQILSDNVTPQDLLVDQFRNLVVMSIENYQAAIIFDSRNYNNYLGIAELYRSLFGLGVAGSYEQSLGFFNQALDLAPNNPNILLSIARLEFEKGDMTRSKELITQSLNKKPNYIDAIFLYSQVEVSEGNIKSAIEAVQVASQIRSDDPTVFFQLGLLFYNDNQFAKAINSLEKSVSLNPGFQNAKYFLGLSYQRENRWEDAVRQFEELSLLNPNNDEVSLILSNLKSRSAPFAGAQSPIDNSPEDREDLPLDEEEIPAE